MAASDQAMSMLKCECETRGLNLAEVPKRAGMIKSNLSRLENDINANPMLDTLSPIARAVGVRLTIGIVAA
jgi:transcriptional regulator with XRE-family HTH domain